MRSHGLRSIAMLAALLGAMACTENAHAQILNIIDSNVEGYFGTTSDAWQQAEGPTIPPWPASGLGFYPITGPPGVPPLYPGFPSPSYPVVSNIPFAAPSGHIQSTLFNDGITDAGYSAVGGFNAPGTATGDAYVEFGVPGAVGMWLRQPPPATGYAYEQASFTISYNVGAGGLAGGSPGPRPFSVYGDVLPGGYAQFGAEVNYWWVTNIPGTTIISSITNLGSLQYNFTINNVTGPFSQIVNYTPTSLLGATGAGTLVITGNAFVTGDPFNIYVTSIPEASTMTLVGISMAGLGMGAFIRRRKAAAR